MLLGYRMFDAAIWKFDNFLVGLVVYRLSLPSQNELP
jgi:hypothetical protein